VLTRNGIIEVAHIYPYCMLNIPLTAREVLQLNFWDILKRFWSDDRVQEWRNAIFPHQNNPDKGVEACYNLICLSPDAYAYWTKAYFALKPIQLSDDKKCLDVEFHWISQYNHSSEIDILTSPLSSEGSGGRCVGLFDIITGQRFYSGKKISLTTDDPVTRPLPHLALLEMQWILHRMTAMSGAAEIYDNVNNDDDDAMALQNEWDSCSEDEWDSYEEESPPIKDHFSPPSSPLYQSSLSSLPKSNIRSDFITLQPAENSSIKTISSSQG
jgi:hypothetical protein